MMLKLAEELLLLAVDDEKGTLKGDTSSLTFALAGALLVELTLMAKLNLEQKRLVVVDAAPVGDEILDEALRQMQISHRARKSQHWVNHFSNSIKHLKSRLLNQLVEKGILSREEHRILGIIPSQRYPVVEFSRKTELENQIRAVVLAGETSTPHTEALISLLGTCGLVNEVFSKEERKIAQKYIKEITRNDVITKGVVDTVNSVQAATMSAVTASIVASTAASCSASTSSCS